MRKLLALVLALVMTLGLATVGTNAADYADQTAVDATDYADAINVLHGMKVFVGNEKNEFMPTESITRASVAAIIYRIATGDVDNKKVTDYINLAKFDDVTSSHWAAGYIGYCYNAGYIKGYNGKFMPDAKVTGYDTIAMILRAVGYDKNHEFEGDGYQVRVASQATKLGMLANVAAEDLKLPATRAAVARILFDAIQVPQVIYSALEQDYVPYNSATADRVVANKNNSLGWEMFKLAYDVNAISDDWGRPYYVWYAEKTTGATEYTTTNVYNSATDSIYYKDVREADAKYNTLAKGCDIIDDLGKSASFDVKDAERYINGENNIKTTAKETTTTTTVSDTTANFGDTKVGRQVEFYKLDNNDVREVVIDTYLAKVTNAVVELKDANDHVTRDDYNTLSVYDNLGLQTANTRHIAGNEYAKGDWLLVNVNEAKTASFKLTTATDSAKEDKVVVVQKADSTEAAQTQIFVDSDKHEIGGKTYNDAYQFNLDEAGTKLTYKMQWFFDQFGNVIGDTNLDRDGYAVLESIRYTTGASEYAEAVLRYFDGETKTVTVRHMDGFGTITDGAGDPLVDGENNKIYRMSDGVTPADGWYGQVDDAVFRLAENRNQIMFTDRAPANTTLTTWNADIPATAIISSSMNENAGFRGLALYRVFSYDDGTVDLEAFEQGTGKTTAPISDVTDPVAFRDNAVNASTDVVTDSDDTLNIKYAEEAFIDPTGTMIVAKRWNETTQDDETVVETHLSSNTKFIYRSGAGTLTDPFVYTVYSGTANLPAMTRDYTAEIFYDGTTSTVSNYVYVKSFNLSTQQGGRHVFIPANDSQYAMRNIGTDLWEIDAIVDGVKTVITGTYAQVNALAQNKDKLFHLTFVNGNAKNLINDNITLATAGGWLVNEATDAQAAIDGGLHTGTTLLNATGACDYLAYCTFDATHTANSSLVGETLITGGAAAAGENVSYNITNAKFHGKVSSIDEFKTLVKDNEALNNLGVWVVSDGTLAGMVLNAKDVYVGKQLSRDTTMTIATKNATVTPAAPTTNTNDVAINGHNDAVNVAVKADAGITALTMTYTPTVTNASATVEDRANVADNTLGADDANTAAVREDVEVVTVTAEDGWHTTTYTVTGSFNNLLKSVLLFEASATGSEMYDTAGAMITNDMLVDAVDAGKNATDAQKEAAVAQSIRNALGMGIRIMPTLPQNEIKVTFIGQDGVTVKAASAAAGADVNTAVNAAKNSLMKNAATLTNTATASGNTWANGGIIVAQVTAKDGTVKYVALRIMQDAELMAAIDAEEAELDVTLAAAQETLANREAAKAAADAALATAKNNLAEAEAALKLAKALNAADVTDEENAYNTAKAAVTDAKTTADNAKANVATAQAAVDAVMDAKDAAALANNLDEVEAAEEELETGDANTNADLLKARKDTVTAKANEMKAAIAADKKMSEEEKTAATKAVNDAIEDLDTKTTVEGVDDILDALNELEGDAASAEEIAQAKEDAAADIAALEEIAKADKDAKMMSTADYAKVQKAIAEAKKTASSSSDPEEIAKAVSDAEDTLNVAVAKQALIDAVNALTDKTIDLGSGATDTKATATDKNAVQTKIGELNLDTTNVTYAAGNPAVTLDPDGYTWKGTVEVTITAGDATVQTEDAAATSTAISDKTTVKVQWVDTTKKTAITETLAAVTYNLEATSPANEQDEYSEATFNNDVKTAKAAIAAATTTEGVGTVTTTQVNLLKNKLGLARAKAAQKKLSDVTFDPNSPAAADPTAAEIIAELPENGHVTYELGTLSFTADGADKATKSADVQVTVKDKVDTTATATKTIKVTYTNSNRTTALEAVNNAKTAINAETIVMGDVHREIATNLTTTAVVQKIVEVKSINNSEVTLAIASLPAAELVNASTDDHNFQMENVTVKITAVGEGLTDITANATVKVTYNDVDLQSAEEAVAAAIGSLTTAPALDPVLSTAKYTKDQLSAKLNTNDSSAVTYTVTSTPNWTVGADTYTFKATVAVEVASKTVPECKDNTTLEFSFEASDLKTVALVTAVLGEDYGGVYVGSTHTYTSATSENNTAALVMGEIADAFVAALKAKDGIAESDVGKTDSDKIKVEVTGIAAEAHDYTSSQTPADATVTVTIDGVTDPVAQAIKVTTAVALTG